MLFYSLRNLKTEACRLAVLLRGLSLHLKPRLLTLQQLSFAEAPWLGLPSVSREESKFISPLASLLLSPFLGRRP